MPVPHGNFINNRTTTVPYRVIRDTICRPQKIKVEQDSYMQQRFFNCILCATSKGIRQNTTLLIFGETLVCKKDKLVVTDGIANPFTYYDYKQRNRTLAMASIPPRLEIALLSLSTMPIGIHITRQAQFKLTHQGTAHTTTAYGLQVCLLQ